MLKMDNELKKKQVVELQAEVKGAQEKKNGERASLRAELVDLKTKMAENEKASKAAVEKAEAALRADRKHSLAANDDEEEKGETKGKESELARELKIVKEEAVKVDENRRSCRRCCCLWWWWWW